MGLFRISRNSNDVVDWIFLSLSPMGFFSSALIGKSKPPRRMEPRNTTKADVFENITMNLLFPNIER
jgi:hypothetical protein